MASEYVFRPMARADLPLIRRWLALPHVRQWWGDPQEQFALVSGDFDEPAMDQYIVGADGSAFAYLQCYALSTWNVGFGVQPAGTRGIDLFIGEAAMLGGHGSTLIRRFVSEQLGGGVPRIVTDPDPANVRAIRAYEKGGVCAGTGRDDRRAGIADGSRLVACPDHNPVLANSHDRLLPP